MPVSVSAGHALGVTRLVDHAPGDDMEDMQRAHLIVRGRVQGVFYRDSTRRKAGELNLKGMVRNLPDGTVEIIAEGAKAELDALVRWARKGPPSAFVHDVDVAWEEPRGEFLSFDVRYGY